MWGLSPTRFQRFSGFDYHLNLFAPPDCSQKLGPVGSLAVRHSDNQLHGCSTYRRTTATHEGSYANSSSRNLTCPSHPAMQTVNSRQPPALCQRYQDQSDVMARSCLHAEQSQVAMKAFVVHGTCGAASASVRETVDELT
jgi:hypothetical protein